MSSVFNGGNLDHRRREGESRREGLKARIVFSWGWGKATLCFGLSRVDFLPTYLTQIIMPFFYRVSSHDFLLLVFSILLLSSMQIVSIE